MSSFDERRPEDRPPLPEDYEGDYRRGAVSRAPERAVQIAAGGSAAEVATGLATVVLAILSLLGLMEATMLHIAVVVGGVGLLFHGAAVFARFSSLSVTPADRPADAALRVGSPPAELVGGIAVTLLGIFALLGYAPLVLTAIAAIVGGAALFLGSWATSELNAPPSYGTGFGVSEQRRSVLGSAGGQALAGLGAIALGIYSRLGYWPMTLNQISFLVIGSTLLLVGTTFGARLMGMLTGRQRYHQT